MQCHMTNNTRFHKCHYEKSTVKMHTYGGTQSAITVPFTHTFGTHIFHLTAIEGQQRH